MKRGMLQANGQAWYGPFQTVPDPGPTDPTDPEDPPPDPEDPPPNPTEPGAFTHGSQANATNTGIAGLGLTDASLTVISSWTSSFDGQVLYGRRINGNVRINHKNVTIRGCKIARGLGGHCVILGTTVSGFKIEYSDIYQDLAQGGDSNGIAGIYHVPSGMPRNLVYRCHIYQVEDLAKLSGGWSFIENYGHIDIKYGSSHNDGLQSQKSSPSFNPSVEILRNKIVMGPNFGNAAVFVTGESGPQYNVTIGENWLQCSSATQCVAVHGQDNIGSWEGTILIRNNKCVEGWNGGPEAFFSLVSVPGAQVVRTGNRRVNVGGTDLGPV